MSEMKAHFQRLYHHMTWADARVLERLRAAPADEGVLDLFAHLLAAERIWLLRLRGHDAFALAVWPQLSVEECAALAEENRAAYAAYLDSLPEDRLASTVTYRNSQGVEYTTSVRDVLTHVALHGSYHRGQIAAALRASGTDPVNTDYVTFVREGAPVVSG